MNPKEGTRSPVDAPDRTDLGDQMQRNVRYQHAYGVVLLIAAVRNELPYVSLWCEQHDDFLAEKPDGVYDAYQIKTATPEDGEWVWTRDGLRDSVKRFVRLNRKFPERIGTFNFVSNVRCLDSAAEDKIKRSPPHLVRSIRSRGRLRRVMQEAFDGLRSHCECSDGDLRSVLKRLNLRVGPGRDSFNEEIAHRHLPALAQCRTMTALELDACLDSLVQVISRASSLDVRDPSKHWCAVMGDDHLDPTLRAKRVLIAAARGLLDEIRATPFLYASAGRPLQLGKGGDYLSVLEKKLVRGGLSEYVGLLSQRAESAERHLLEMNALSPETFESKLNQIASVVKCECDEARLEASAAASKAPYGPAMLRDVHRRLRALAKDRPEMVHREEYDLLAGFAGLLSGDCKVWWSEPFDVEAA